MKSVSFLLVFLLLVCCLSGCAITKETVHGAVPVGDLTDEQLVEEMQSISAALGTRLNKAVLLAAIMPPPSNVVTRYGNTVDQNSGAEALVGFLQLHNALKVRRLSERARAIIEEVGTRIKQNVDEVHMCTNKVNSNPAYVGIIKHVPADPSTPTLAQLTDDTVPSEEDSKNIAAFYDEMEPCFKLATEGILTKVNPSSATVFIQSYHENTLIAADLIQRKITYGEANKRRMAVGDEFRAKIQALSDH